MAPHGGAAQRPPGGGSALPCLNSNKCNEGAIPAHLRDACNRLSTNHRKTAYKLSKSVARLCAKYGIQRIGFLTLTFADHVTCAKVAGKRFSSLRTGVLTARYGESICVLERMKSGRIHFHLLVVLGDDIRTGFNFDQAANGDYSSANAALRSEWAFWRRTAKLYGFGRTELLPVKSNEEGLSKYVGKYIAKHVGAREMRDKGVRLVRYSSGASIGSNAFAFVSHRGRLWRHQVSKFAAKHGCADFADLSARFGKRWAYSHRADIMAIEPDPIAVGARFNEAFEEMDVVTLWDVWHADRVGFAALVSSEVGCTHGEAYMSLFQPEFCAKRTVDFAVPRWSGEKVNTDAKDDFSDVTLITWSPEDLNQVRIARQRVEASHGPLVAAGR